LTHSFLSGFFGWSNGEADEEKVSTALPAGARDSGRDGQRFCEEGGEDGEECLAEVEQRRLFQKKY
jgi:hypothetical protein